MKRLIVLVLALAACGRSPGERPASAVEPERVVRVGDDAGSATVAVVGDGVIERAAVAPAADGRDGVHGMIIFGGDVLHVSHLPMFHPPHDVQLVARVRIAGDGDVPARLDGLHTLAPERFRLDDVLSGKRTTFRAALHRGNFEAGGPKLATVDVTIEQLVIARPLDGGREDEHYVVVGGSDWWLVHRIAGETGADAIARVTFAESPTPGRYLLRGPAATGSTLTRPGATLTITDLRPISCLVGPDFTRPCAP